MLKSKSFYVSGLCVACAVAVVSITSMGINSSGDKVSDEEKSYLKNDNSGDKEVENVDLSDKIGQAKPTEPENGYIENQNKTDENAVIGEEGNSEEVMQDLIEESPDEKEESKDEKKDNKKEPEKTDKKDNSKTDNKEQGKEESVPTLSFNEEEGLAWPVTGDVIMQFSQDEMLYYKTLGQFMSSDKILIEAAVGDKVKACAAGKVTDISSSRETKTAVTVSIGNGYSIVYGEVENLTVKEGDSVKEGQIIGTVASPSGYYSKEGTNLYLKVMENGKAVNPMYLLK